MVYDSRIDDEIDYYGTDITFYSPTGIIYTDKWGNSSNDINSSSITVVLNDVTGGEEWNTEGQFVPGDKLLFLKSSDDLNIDDYVEINSEYYKVVQKPIRHNVQNENQQKEVPVKRVGDSLSDIS